MSPFDVRKERASEVFLFMRRLNNYNIRQNKKTKSNNKKVIRKKAGDDWF